MAERNAVAGRTSLRLLGQWHLIADGVAITLGEREQRLTALLGLRGRRSWMEVARDLWPESTDETALSRLGWAVLRTERWCPGLLQVDRATVALDPAVDVDVADLPRTAGLTGRPVSASGGDRGSDDALHRLLGSQELLVGWHDDWVVDERERIQRLRVRAVERLSPRLEVGDAIVAAAGASDIESPLEESDRHRGATGEGPSLGRAGGAHRLPAAPPPGPTGAAARVAGLTGLLLVCPLVLAFVLVLAWSGPSGESGPPPPADTTRPSPTLPAAARLVPAQVLHVEPRQLTVRASGAVGSVTLMITATRRPAPVRLALWSPARTRLAAAQQVVVRAGSERLTWRGLAAGVYRWHATSPTAPGAWGRVEVSAEPAPVTPAPEASSTPTATPTSDPAPSPTATAPSPTSNPTPAPTADPGPTGPVDPHTQAPPPVG